MTATGAEGWIRNGGMVVVDGEWLDSGGDEGRSVIIVTTADGQIYTK